jgi:hypothetical protein
MAKLVSVSSRYMGSGGNHLRDQMYRIVCGCHVRAAHELVDNSDFKNMAKSVRSTQEWFACLSTLRRERVWFAPPLLT